MNSQRQSRDEYRKANRIAANSPLWVKLLTVADRISETAENHGLCALYDDEVDGINDAMGFDLFPSRERPIRIIVTINIEREEDAYEAANLVEQALNENFTTRNREHDVDIHPEDVDK